MNKITITNKLKVSSASSGDFIKLLKQNMPITRTSYSYHDEDIVSLIEEAFPDWESQLSAAEYPRDCHTVQDVVNYFKIKTSSQLIIKLDEFDKIDFSFMSDSISVADLLGTGLSFQRPAESVKKTFDEVYEYIDNMDINDSTEITKEVLKEFFDTISATMYPKNGNLRIYGEHSDSSTGGGHFSDNIADYVQYSKPDNMLLIYIAAKDIIKTNVYDMYGDMLYVGNSDVSSQYKIYDASEVKATTDMYAMADEYGTKLLQYASSFITLLPLYCLYFIDDSNNGYILSMKSLNYTDIA